MSAAPKFTPGPWRAVAYRERGGVPGVDAMIESSDDKHLADVYEGQANARLIAAAPELYEALRQCEDLLAELADGGAENPELEIARAALAKVS